MLACFFNGLSEAPPTAREGFHNTQLCVLYQYITNMHQSKGQSFDVLWVIFLSLFCVGLVS